MTTVEAVSPWEWAARAFEPPALIHLDPFVNQGPAALAAALDPVNYHRRPHLDAISDAWRDIHAGTTDRLAVSLPSQAGKTTTAVDWAVFWWLIQHPRDRVAVASYGDSLSVVRGRSIRRLIETHGEAYGLKLDPFSRAAHDWALTTGGGVLSVGVGSGFTGRPCDCVSGGTRIVTRDGPEPIEEFVRRGAIGEVLSYNHATGRPEFRRVVAARVIPGRPLVEIRTARGLTLRCTPDHRVYVIGRGYIPAGRLSPGDRLRDVRSDTPQLPLADSTVLLPSLRGMRQRVQPTSVRGRQGAQDGLAEAVLLDRVQGTGLAGRPPLPMRSTRAGREGLLLPRLPTRRLPGPPGVLDLWEGLYPTALRPSEEGPSGANRPRLLPGLRGQAVNAEDGPTLPDVRQGHAQGTQPQVLLRPVPTDRCPPSPAAALPRGAVPDLSKNLPAEEQPACLLHPEVRRQGPLGADERQGQLPVPDRHELRETVPEHAPADCGARHRLCGVRSHGAHRQVHPEGEALPAEQPGRPPHQCRPEGQPAGEPDRPVSHLSLGTPQVGDDTVSVVRRLRGESHTVYDIQVAGNRNFFADGVLVHNCAVIDDPHKDRAEADSAAVRRSVHEWWSAVVVPRMAPRAPVVIVATRWHPDDLIGRVTQHEGVTTRGGRWRVVSMPALCTDPATDPLGRGAGDPLPHPRITIGDTAALMKHWLERRTSMTPRDWESICQCNPQPPGGTLLNGDELRNARHLDPADHPEPVRVGVSVDPSGGGRDTAGIIAGYLGADGRLWYTHDATMRGPADQWARAAAQLAGNLGADVIVYESNYGGDMARVVIRTAWDALAREGSIPADRQCPRLLPVSSRRGKLLRAEPVAQAFREDRIRTGAYMPELESEWCTWQPTSTESPGRIDASVHLAWALLPPPGSQSEVGVPSGQMPVVSASPFAGQEGGGGAFGLGPLG